MFCILLDPPELGHIYYNDKAVFEEGFQFGYAFIAYLLVKYRRSEWILKRTKETNSSTEKTSLFCDHIGEAILAVSYVNRLKFKLLFDGAFDYIISSINTYYLYLTKLCKDIYKEGYFDQFLVTCSIVTDITLYMCNRVGPMYAGVAPYLFGSLYENILYEKFLKSGGWNELRKNARPWWRAYKYSRKHLEFHCPEYELLNPYFTYEKLLECMTPIEVYEERYISDSELVIPQTLKEQASCYTSTCQSFCLTTSVINDSKDFENSSKLKTSENLSNSVHKPTLNKVTKGVKKKNGKQVKDKKVKLP